MDVPYTDPWRYALHGATEFARSKAGPNRKNNKVILGRGTHKPPTAKIEMRPIFCLLPKFNPWMTGIGRRMIAKSVTMLIAAFVNQTANWFRQVAFSWVQKARTGMQVNILEKTVHMV
jgi:hypothetical protein